MGKRYAELYELFYSNLNITEKVEERARKICEERDISWSEVNRDLVRIAVLVGMNHLCDHCIEVEEDEEVYDVELCECDAQLDLSDEWDVEWTEYLNDLEK